MDKLVQYVNPNPHNVQLIGPDRKPIIVPAHQKIILSDWFIERYVPKYLQVVRALDSKDRPAARIERSPVVIKPIRPVAALPPAANMANPMDMVPQAIVRAPQPLPATHRLPPRDKQLIQRRNAAINITQNAAPKHIAEPVRESPRAQRRKKRDILIERPVGRSRTAGADLALHGALSSYGWGISNNIGIGILSFNRLDSLKRLIASIRKYTDLTRTTIFVSDESTNPDVPEWLQTQSDLVVLTNQPRLGVAGNSNRLLRCLSRFRYCYLLNDDVEILEENWADHYINAHLSTNFHHFCFRQIGLLNANRGEVKTIGNYLIDTITEKPHGAVLFYTNDAFRRVGYFDEQFGIYGMEHVDWSHRVGLSGIQPAGYHDVLGADKFFKIHPEASAVDKSQFHAMKLKFTQLSAIRDRIYVKASDATQVPKISVIIPVRNTERDGAIEAVINNIRGQLYPSIDLIVIEQDYEVRTSIDKFRPCSYHLAQSRDNNQPFTKALAFNFGVCKAICENIILHDADMLAPRDYVKQVAGRLTNYEGAHLGKTVLYLNRTASADVISKSHLQANSECERIVDYFEGGSLACTRSAYVNIGGFNESYEGYGVEDCDFFERLKYCTKFSNDRTIPLIHLWHGRTPGWEEFHERNKAIKADINLRYGVTAKLVEASPADIAGLKLYAQGLAQQYKMKYGQTNNTNS